MTDDDLFALVGQPGQELVRGVLRVREPPGGIHGWLATRLAHLLHAHVERHGLGTVLVDAGYVLQRNPDTVRGPDVSFISSARLAREQIPANFIEGAPDLAIEVVSAEDRWSELEEKVADYFAAGTSLVWIVDPKRQCVIVRRPGSPPAVVGVDGVLHGQEVVPRFRCAVTEVFGAPPAS